MKSIQRMFIPGSEWVYLKIYAGNKTINKILADEIPVIVKTLEQENIITKWFFLRYSDSDFHLRIRFLLNNNNYSNRVLELFYKRLKKLTNSSLIWKIQLDTYVRELERYGNGLIDESESIFHEDSKCILTIINSLGIFKNENYSWMIALKLIDCFLTDFSFDLPTKQLLLVKLSNSYKSEFGFDNFNSKQFNTMYRAKKNTVELVLGNHIFDKDFNILCEIIEVRSRKLKPIINQLSLKIKRDKKGIMLEGLITSYLHMTINRLFISKNRTYELILYDFLRRYYSSELAKNKYVINN